MKENSLVVIKRDNIFIKIKNFILKIFYRNSLDEELNNNVINAFNDEIKTEKDEELETLLFIQNNIENGDLNKNSVYEATKELSQYQIECLKNLYEGQIENLEKELEDYKSQIIEIRSKLEQADNL